MRCFLFLHWIKFCSGCFRWIFFSFRGQKKWLLVALDRWSSYTVTIVWELAWVDSAMVILDKWLTYRGGRISRFDCNLKLSINKMWLIFSLLHENSIAAMTFHKIKPNGINAKTNAKGDEESPWKIPHLISTSSSEFPAHNITSRFLYY